MFYVVGENNYRRCYYLIGAVPADMVMAKKSIKTREEQVRRWRGGKARIRGCATNFINFPKKLATRLHSPQKLPP